MAWDWTLSDSIRNHDQAVYDWLGGLAVDYGEISGTPFPSREILRIFATPDNAFAKMADVLIRKGWIQRPTQQETLDAASYYLLVPLPMASIYRSSVDLNPEYANVPGSWRKLTYDRETGHYQNHPYPATYTITYDIDFWCLKKYTEAHIYEWIMSNMGKIGSSHHEMMLTVKHGDPWGDKLHGFRLESFVDNTELENIEAERRYLRYTASLVLNAFIFRMPEEGAKPVLQINNSYYDKGAIDGITNSDGQLLEQQAVETAYFRDNGTVPNYLLKEFFVRTGDATIQRSKLTPDGRIDQFTGKSKNGKYGAFALTGSSGATILNETLVFSNPMNPLVFRFNYLALEEPFWFEITDGESNTTQYHILPTNRKWMCFETFVMATERFGIRFGTDAITSSVLRIDNLRFTQINQTELIPVISDSVIGDSRVIRFDGMNKNRPYFLCAYPLNLTSNINILIGDAGANPLLTTRIEAVSGKWFNVATVIQPRDTGSATITFEHDPAPAPANLIAFEYYGFKTGTLHTY